MESSLNIYWGCYRKCVIVEFSDPLKSVNIINICK